MNRGIIAVDGSNFEVIVKIHSTLNAIMLLTLSNNHYLNYAVTVGSACR